MEVTYCRTRDLDFHAREFSEGFHETHLRLSFHSRVRDAESLESREKLIQEVSNEKIDVYESLILVSRATLLYAILRAGGVGGRLRCSTHGESSIP